MLDRVFRWCRDWETYEVFSSCTIRSDHWFLWRISACHLLFWRISLSCHWSDDDRLLIVSAWCRSRWDASRIWLVLLSSYQSSPRRTVFLYRWGWLRACRAYLGTWICTHIFIMFLQQCSTMFWRDRWGIRWRRGLVSWCLRVLDHMILIVLILCSSSSRLCGNRLCTYHYLGS